MEHDVAVEEAAFLNSFYGTEVFEADLEEEMEDNSDPKAEEAPRFRKK